MQKKRKREERVCVFTGHEADDFLSEVPRHLATSWTCVKYSGEDSELPEGAKVEAALATVGI